MAWARDRYVEVESVVFDSVYRHSSRGGHSPASTARNVGRVLVNGLWPPPYIRGSILNGCFGLPEGPRTSLAHYMPRLPTSVQGSIALL